MAADRALRSESRLSLRWVLVRTLVMALANVADLEARSRPLYRDNRELGEQISSARRALDFAKYLRNIVVGHLNPAVTHSMVRWRPELLEFLQRQDENSLAFINLAAMEAAINSYVDDGGHKFFDSESDLVLPDEMQRFLNFLGETVLSSISYVDALANVAIANAQLPDYSRESARLIAEAAATEWAFVTRGGQR